MEEFTKKEVPRAVDDIRPVVETLDKLASDLEDAKNEAMVSQYEQLNIYTYQFCSITKRF